MELEADASRFSELVPLQPFSRRNYQPVVGQPRNNELIQPQLHEPAMHLER
jgi:hypothetical protein